MSKERKIVIEITPRLDGDEFTGETFDPTPVLIKFLSSINTIPPRALKDYGPVFPLYKADKRVKTYYHEGYIDVKTDITLIQNLAD